MAAPFPSADPAGAPAGSVIALRPAVADDLDAILAIEQASFGDPWPRGAFTSLLRRPDAWVVVATADRPPASPASPPGPAAGGAVLGYAIAWFIVGEGEVGNVAVHPDARGRGVGARLLDEALAEARRRGAAVMFLEVRESNDAARRLYTSRGFVEVGRRRRYYRRPDEDALVMRWDGGSPA